MIANKIDLATTRFKIEPGDGTGYAFSITYLPVGGNIRDVVPGVGDKSDYVTLTIHNQPTGSHEVLRISLRNPNKGFIQYLCSPGHGFRHVHPYTVAAVVLAASVLVDGGSLGSAADSMLRAGELL